MKITDIMLDDNNEQFHISIEELYELRGTIMPFVSKNNWIEHLNRTSQWKDCQCCGAPSIGFVKLKENAALYFYSPWFGCCMDEKCINMIYLSKP